MVAVRHDFRGTSSVAVGGRYVADPRMPVLRVVPVDELGEPDTRLIDIEESTRVARCELDGFEQCFAIRIVVAHARTRVRRENPQREEQGEDCYPFHRVAVVRVKPHAINVVGSSNTTKELSGVGFRLLGVDLPADDLAAPHIHEDVGVQEDPVYAGG